MSTRIAGEEVRKAGTAGDPSPGSSPYHLRISRLTVDKLGVKLYDKASAVVAELIANSYDADAEEVVVTIPLAVQLATKSASGLQDRGLLIEVKDNGHGMSPDEAKKFFLVVGTDRRARPDGSRSRKKKRPVMGRKGIGKLAPFGICRRIELMSAGGPPTKNGYAVTHFFLDFDRIVKDEDTDVPLDVGASDGTWSEKPGTTIRLTSFLAKRVPDEETFLRQLAVRFTFARPDFQISVLDSSKDDPRPVKVNPLDIPLSPGTRSDLSTRPVIADDGTEYPVSGWLGMAKDAYKNDEMAGVRIYARGKIVGVTRDFNQPAGFTGEFTMRSYLVGKVEAEWLDLDDGEDLIRTDRQDILWDSEFGQMLRKWGAELIKEIAAKSREPRRKRVSDLFMQKSKIEARARERFGDKEVTRIAVELASKVGGFAAEDELDDKVYVDDLTNFILSVAPHKALIEAFQEFNSLATKGESSVEHLIDIFDKTQLAELASYAQIAAERVRAIGKLKQLIDDSFGEDKFQELLAAAPWLIDPTWTVITVNQGLRTFKDAFESYYKKKHKKEITLAINYQSKRPDFTLISIDGLLHIVEIKKPDHDFDQADSTRLLNYVEAFEEFFDNHKGIAANFPRGWRIDLVADGVKIKEVANRRAFRELTEHVPPRVVRISWLDFLDRAKKTNERFLEVHEKKAVSKKAAGKAPSKGRRR
jgi:hypothetical protein